VVPYWAFKHTDRTLPTEVKLFHPLAGLFVFVARIPLAAVTASKPIKPPIPPPALMVSLFSKELQLAPGITVTTDEPVKLVGTAQKKELLSPENIAPGIAVEFH
jgi:hypothetical protein